MNQTRDAIIASLAELEPRLRSNGVTHLALFGSRARQDNRADSDLDVAIDVRPDSQFSLLDLVGVAQTIEGSLSLTANVFMRRSLKPPFRAALERDGISIF